MAVSPHRVKHPTRDKGAAHTLADHHRRLNHHQSTGNIIGPGSIQGSASDGSGDIAPGSIDGTDIAPSSITTGNIAAGAITASSLSAGAVTAGAIAAGSITATAIQAGAISSYLFAGNTITLAVSGASSNRVVLDSLGLHAYDGSGVLQTEIKTDGSITTTKGTITGGTIQTSAGFTNRVIMDSAGIRAYNAIGVNSVNIDTGGNLTVSQGTITGTTIQTASAGARVVMDPLGIRAYDAIGTNKLNIDSTTGLITATGVITAMPGSTVPWGQQNFIVGGGNLLSNSSAEDPTTIVQTLYPSGVPIVNMVEVNADGTRNGSAGFEVDTVGWATLASNRITTGGGAFTRLTTATTTSHSGSGLLRVVTTTAGAGMGADFTTLSVTASQPYTASAWVKGNVGGETVQMVVGSAAAGIVTQNITLTTAWQRVTRTYTPAATGTIGLAIKTQTAAAVTFYVDDVQFETGSTANTYTASYFFLSYTGGGTTLTSAALYVNATAAQVQAALNTAGVLPTGMSATCTGGPLPNSITITINGANSPTGALKLTRLDNPVAPVVGGTINVGFVPQNWATILSNDALEAIVYPQSYHGGRVFQLTTNSNSSSNTGITQFLGPIGPTPGVTRYTASAYVKAPTASRLARMGMLWTDAFGDTVGKASVNSTWNTSLNWQRLLLTDTVPVAGKRQLITMSTVNSGWYSFVYNGKITQALPFNATATQIQTALSSLPNVGAGGIGFVNGGPLPTGRVGVTFLTSSRGEGTAADPISPMTVTNALPYVVGSTTTNTVPTGIQANDLLIYPMYVEPQNEGAGATATYNTITAPSGWTILAIVPINTNDASLTVTSSKTSRYYIAYRWATGAEGGTTVNWLFNGATVTPYVTGAQDYYQPNGIIAIRGASDSVGTYTGTPYIASNTATYSKDTHAGAQTSALPSVSVNTGTQASLLLYFGSDLDSHIGVPPSGWSTVAANNRTSTVLQQSQVSGGGAATIAPTIIANTGRYQTSVLLAIGNADTTAISHVLAANSPSIGITTQPGVVSPAIGEQFYIDAVQLEVGDVPTAYSPRGDEILANVVQANMINVVNLSAISANLGTIVAGNITGVGITGVTITGSTITGSTIQTSTASPRTVLDSTGFYVTDSSGNKVVTIDASQGIVIVGQSSQGVYNTIQWSDSTFAYKSAGMWADSQATQGVLTMYAGVAGSFSQFSLGGASGPNQYGSINFEAVGPNSYAEGAVMDALGQSSFLQLPSNEFVPNYPTPSPSAVWFGAVNGDGSVRLTGSGNWTVSRNTTGSYSLTLNGGPAGIWAIPIIQAGNEQQLMTSNVTFNNRYDQYGTGTTIVVVDLWVTAFSVQVDKNWSFCAFAAR